MTCVYGLIFWPFCCWLAVPRAIPPPSSAATFHRCASRQEVARSKGYAVFTNVNNNLLVLSAGSGYGVLRDNRTGRDTYMKMATAGMGIGMGIKKFQAVIIFNDAAALDRFITTGFDASAQADLAAKSAEDGKVVVSEAANADFQKVKMYQLTEKGVAVQATMQGYKYWPDDDLNGTK